MIICFDFDGTLVENCYPKIGKPMAGDILPTRIEEAIRLKELGHKIILFTCREGHYLKNAVRFCKNRGLIFDAVNDDLNEIKERFSEGLESWKKSGRARKVFADIYVDDRAYAINTNGLLNYLGALK